MKRTLKNFLTGCIESRAWRRAVGLLREYNFRFNPLRNEPVIPSGVNSEAEFVIPTAPRNSSAFYNNFANLETLFRLLRAWCQSPKHVTQHVEHALQARWPRRRYLAGLDAKILAVIVWLVPMPIIEGVMSWVV